MYTITYCPELNVYTLHNGRTEIAIAATELPSRSEAVREVCRQAVESGRAVSGICIS